MDLEQLERVMKLAKAYRVSEVSLCDDGVVTMTVKFEPGWSIAEPTAPSPQPIGEEKGYPTEDELLYASSPDGPPDQKAHPP